MSRAPETPEERRERCTRQTGLRKASLAKLSPEQQEAHKAMLKRHKEAFQAAHGYQPKPRKRPTPEQKQAAEDVNFAAEKQAALERAEAFQRVIEEWKAKKLR